MDDFVYENGSLVSLTDAFSAPSTSSGFWSDPIGQMLGYYGTYYDLQQTKRLNDLQYQQAQLRAVQSFTTTGTVAAPAAGAAKVGIMDWIKANPLMAAGGAVLAVLALKKLKVV